MALTNNIITMYMMHTRKKTTKKHYITITYVLDYCTNIKVIFRTAEQTRGQKYQSVQLQQKCFEKKYPKADTRLD